MEHMILAINPGSTSTKIALYQGESLCWSENIEHQAADLAEYPTIKAQMAWRQQVICNVVEGHGSELSQLSAVVGRGGLLPPVKAGGYAVNDRMLDFLYSVEVGFHASNLGALLAYAIAEPLGIPSYIYDAVSADEMHDVAHITGMPEVERHSFCHVLNSKAMCRKYAESLGKAYEDMACIVAHLGGGVTASAHLNGRIVDSIADDDGCFSPERSGAIPIRSIIQLCYTGDYTRNDMYRKQRGAGGLKALLGDHDCRRIEARILDGDEKAKLVYEAFAYQVAKGIGLMSVTLGQRPDAIILTGGVAYSTMLCEMITKWVGYICDVVVLPGENELESLALGALRILNGQESAHTYVE